MSSTIDPAIAPLVPSYPAPPPSAPRTESSANAAVIAKLNLQPHVEGGYFVETDRDSYRIAKPFLTSNGKSGSESTGAGSGGRSKRKADTGAATTFYTSTGAVSADLGDKLNASDKQDASSKANTAAGADADAVATRCLSTSIHYLLTPCSPQGSFHRNRGRTIHTLHKGRARYVIIHADDVMDEYDSHAVDDTGSLGEKKKSRIETFVVGTDVLAGERIQWIVEGGKYKASFLLPANGDRADGFEGVLISETVTPGFEYADHDFLREDRLQVLVKEEQADELDWLLRRDV